MRVEFDPLHNIEANYVEPADVNMVEISEFFRQDWKIVEARIADDTIEKSIMVVEAATITEASKTKFVKVVKRGVVRATDGLTSKMKGVCITEGAGMGVNVIEVSPLTEMDFDLELEEVEDQAAFPKVGENLVEFLCRCQKSKSEVMLCPRCSGVFDKKSGERVEGSKRLRQ